MSAAWSVYRPRLTRLLSRSPALFLEELENAKAFGGDFVRVRRPPIDVHVISDPEAIEHVLVRNWRNYARRQPARSYVRRGVGDGLLTSDGELHERQRQLIQPFFRPSEIGELAGLVAEATEQVARSWSARADRLVDLNADMLHLTMRAISRVLFGGGLEREIDETARAIQQMNAATTTFDASAGGYLYAIPTRANRRFRQGKRYLDRLIARLLAEQRRRGPEQNVLSQLLRAQEESRAALDDTLLRDELVTLLAAGHETTANMLSWTWLLLAENPEVETRLHGELDDVLGGRPPTLGDLPALEHLDRILKESMRIYPPVWGNGRVAIGDDVVAGRALPAGATVTPSPWLVHRDPRWFPDPLRFDPDRFTREASAARPRFSYFPFGGGNRICPGMSFAEIEGKLVLATLAQRFTPRLPPRAVVVPEASISLRPRGGLAMCPVPRTR